MDTYTSTEEDILRAYIPTAGIHQSNFTSSRIEYQLFDTADSSLERGKWTLYIEEHDYDVLIFVVDISEYNEYQGETVSESSDTILLGDLTVTNKFNH